MSRIDQLIAELAPNGVQFATLGDVGQFIRGNGLQKSDLTEQGTPAYSLWSGAHLLRHLDDHHKVVYKPFTGSKDTASGTWGSDRRHDE